jgi:2-keto-4-pentenoate hydratase/2-oxohepta-3-ene-1,7-dioic acid hydratase in catechol pathway
LPAEVGSVFALGLTYAEHVRETASTQAVEGPEVFAKDRASWFLDGDEVAIPSSETMVAALENIDPGIRNELRKRFGFLPAMMDYEVELGLLLLEDASKTDLATDSFAPRIGYFLAGDLTARSCQVLGEGSANKMAYWGISKSFPGFLPVAPKMWIPEGRVADERVRVQLSTRVNGALRQSASTTEMVWPPDSMLRHVARSTGADLRRGDVILTGTPAGVALSVSAWQRRVADLLFDRFGKLERAISAYRRSPSFLWPGDRVDFDAEALGSRSVTMTDSG